MLKGPLFHVCHPNADDADGVAILRPPAHSLGSTPPGSVFGILADPPPNCKKNCPRISIPAKISALPLVRFPARAIPSENYYFNGMGDPADFGVKLKPD